MPVISAIVRRRTWEYHLGHWERLPLAELPVQEIKNLRAEVRFWLPQSASPPEFRRLEKLLDRADRLLRLLEESSK